MVPFFGSHVRQRTVNFDGNEGMLDAICKVAGSQQISKEGTSAFILNSEKNMGWAHGIAEYE